MIEIKGTKLSKPAAPLYMRIIDDCCIIDLIIDMEDKGERPAFGKIQKFGNLYVYFRPCYILGGQC